MSHVMTQGQQCPNFQRCDDFKLLLRSRDLVLTLQTSCNNLAILPRRSSVLILGSPVSSSLGTNHPGLSRTEGSPGHMCSHCRDLQDPPEPWIHYAPKSDSVELHPDAWPCLLIWTWTSPGSSGSALSLLHHPEYFLPIMIPA